MQRQELKKSPSSFLILLLYFLCVSTLCGSDYFYSDGSGNRYRISKEKLISLQYFPITPLESSSGFYSGGEPKSGFISEKELSDFLKIIKSLPASEKVKSPNRRMGTGYLYWVKKGKKTEFVFEFKSDSYNRVESFLKKCLDNMKSNHLINQSFPEEFSISREESPWLGMTSSFEEEEKGKHIRAMSIPTSEYVAITLPEALVFENRSLLYRSEEKREVVVDSSIFTNLERVDVTRLSKGESVQVGQIIDPSFNKPNYLIPFLLKGQILITYWHTSANVTFKDSEKKGAIECFQFNGKHEYFTNEKNVSKYQFQICIDRDSGKIQVIGD
jgi:hypothetical protein